MLFKLARRRRLVIFVAKLSLLIGLPLGVPWKVRKSETKYLFCICKWDTAKCSIYEGEMKNERCYVCGEEKSPLFPLSPLQKSHRSRCYIRRVIFADAEEALRLVFLTCEGGPLWIVLQLLADLPSQFIGSLFCKKGALFHKFLIFVGE